jgi:hypothetical protein
VKDNVKDVRLMLDAARLVGGLSVAVVADTAVESSDITNPLMDFIVMLEYVVLATRPETVTGLDVTPLSTGLPLTYTV